MTRRGRFDLRPQQIPRFFISDSRNKMKRKQYNHLRFLAEADSKKHFEFIEFSLVNLHISNLLLGKS